MKLNKLCTAIKRAKLIINKSIIKAQFLTLKSLLFICTISMCFLSCTFCVYFFSHWSHPYNILSARWVRLWFLKQFIVLNPFPHCWQMTFLWSVWISRCSFNFVLSLNILLQMSHWNARMLLSRLIILYPPSSVLMLLVGE